MEIGYGKNVGRSKLMQFHARLCVISKDVSFIISLFPYHVTDMFTGKASSNYFRLYYSIFSFVFLTLGSNLICFFFKSTSYVRLNKS